MSYFDGHDVDDIPDNPNELPNNTYKFKVISAKLGPTKDKTKTGIIFKYQIIEGPWATYFPLVEWVRVPDRNTKPDEVARMLSYLKMRLIAFGFTVEEISKFGEDSEKDCINRVFYGTTTIKKDSNNNINVKVQKFDPVEDGGNEDLIPGIPSSEPNSGTPF